MTHVTCRLTAKNRDQLRNPTLGNRVWDRAGSVSVFKSVSVFVFLVGFFKSLYRFRYRFFKISLYRFRFSVTDSALVWDTFFTALSLCWQVNNHTE